MSEYVKRILQCDICDGEIVSGQYEQGPNAGEIARPQRNTLWNFDTCADCSKELMNAVDTLKTVMQIKRGNGELPSTEVKMTRKEWDQIRKSEKAAVPSHAGGPWWEQEELRERMRQFQLQDAMEKKKTATAMKPPVTALGGRK